MAGSRFDSPFAGGTTWDVAGHTVVGVIEPAMIPVLRRGSESVIDALREGVAELDAEMAQRIHATHTAFLAELPVLGGLVQLTTADQVEVWLQALYDHRVLAHEIDGEPPDDLALWCQHTMSKINVAAEKARPPRR